MALRRGSVLAVLPLLVLTLFLVGCPKRPATTAASAPAPAPAPAPAAPDAPVSPPPSAAAPTAPSPSAPGPAAPAPTPAPAPATPPRPSEFRAHDALKDVYFDFDKYDIRPNDARTLDTNAGWLKQNTGQLLLIEGHADERGTNEYNLALGERRAKAAMNYLVSQGVQAPRITIISYGEERPVCADKSEACWSQNRRAHFLVKER
jgi:peptidoglycan-associated lipoprotein